MLPLPTASRQSGGRLYRALELRHVLLASALHPAARLATVWSWLGGPFGSGRALFWRQGIGRIGQRRRVIGLIRPIPTKARSGRHRARPLPGLIEPLRETALLQKRLLQLPKLLVQQVVRLMH